MANNKLDPDTLIAIAKVLKAKGRIDKIDYESKTFKKELSKELKAFGKEFQNEGRAWGKAFKDLFF